MKEGSPLPFHPPRISIAGLSGLMVACAISFASLRYRSYLWASALIGFAAIALATATLSAIVRRARCSYLGFAVFGWTYSILNLGFVLIEAVANSVEGFHPVTNCLDLLYPMLFPKILQGPPPETDYSFQATGHALAFWIFAFSGALLARALEPRVAAGIKPLAVGSPFKDPHGTSL